MKKVVFVCIHNSGRSQMAEAFGKIYGKDKIISESAGTIPGTKLNPAAVEAMAEIGYDLTSHSPKLMTEEMVKTADKVISIGCGVDAEACPVKFIITEDWGLEDPNNQPIEKVRVIRDEIKERVIKLIDELTK